MAAAPPTGSTVRASLAWSYGAHLLVFAVTFAGIVAVSRLLTPRELGIFGVGFAIAGVLSAVSQFGVANFLIREREVTPQTAATCFTVNALISLAIAAALLLLGTLGSGLFDDLRRRDGLRCAAEQVLIVKHPAAPAHACLSGAKYIPGKAKAPAQVVVITDCAIWWHARIAPEQHAWRRIFELRRAHVVAEVFGGEILNPTAHLASKNAGRQSRQIVEPNDFRHLVETFERQFLDFGDAIRTGRKPRVAGEEGYQALEIVDAVYRSCRTREKVTL